MTAWDEAAWRGRKVTVAGLGTFGGSVAAAKFFAALGAQVTVTDKKPREALEKSVGELDGLGVSFALGGHRDDDFTKSDLVVASPAVPEDSPYLRMAEESHVPITHEMDMFFDLCRAPIIAVTGSNGKSTTAALLAHILEKCLAKAGRRVWLGGNIGRSLLLDARRIPPEDVVVLELSSFQLEDLGALEMSPHGAVVTNLSPNHLDRHGTFENYARAKRNVTLFQSADDFLVLNADDEALKGWEDTAAEAAYFGKLKAKDRPGVYVSGRRFVSTVGGAAEEADVPAGWKLRGAHNLLNLAAACAAARLMGVGLADAFCAAGDFEPLAHRLEYVGEVEGVRFYNDSIATTPESVMVALESFEEPIVLIAGGYDKKLDLSAFARKAAHRVKALAAIGQTSGQIADAALGESPDLAVTRPETFAAAVSTAFDAASPGDVVLLSPGCASYDMFNNFQERGHTFRAEVENMARDSKELKN